MLDYEEIQVLVSVGGKRVSHQIPHKQPSRQTVTFQPRHTGNYTAAVMVLNKHIEGKYVAQYLAEQYSGDHLSGKIIHKKTKKNVGLLLHITVEPRLKTTLIRRPPCY